MKKALFLLLLLPVIALSQTTIAQWNGYVANTGTLTSSATTTATYVNATDITGGNATQYSQTWSGTETSSFSNQQNANKYIQFGVSPQSGASFTISAIRFTYQGSYPSVLIKTSFTGDFTDTTDYSFTIPNASTTSDKAVTYSFGNGIVLTSSQKFYVRIYAYGNNNANWILRNANNNSAGLAPTILGTVTPPPSLNGTYTIGATGCDFTTITNAVTRLNGVGVSGPVIFSLKDANYNNTTGETFPIVINSYTGASATNTVTFKPAAGVNTSITATNINSYTGVPALFVLKGADYVTFDGSNTTGGTSRNLKLIGNDNIDYNHRSIIWVASNGSSDGATYNTIKNCYIRMNYRSSESTYNVGVYSGKYATGNAISTEAAEADNAYLTVQANDFDNVKQGVYVNGNSSSSLRTSNVVIKNNDLGASTTESIICPAILNNVNTFTYSENAIYNLYRNTTAGALISAGIYVGGNSIGGTITRNTMKNLVKTTTESYTFGGVVLASTNATSNILVANNFIANAAGNNNGSPVLNGHGISIISGGGYKIYHNSVVLGTSQSGTENGYAAGLYVTNASTVDVRNNIFVNNQTSTLTRRCAILLDGAIGMVSNLDYNNVYSTDKIGYVGTNASWFENPAYQTSLTGWKTATGKEAHSISYAPAFTSTTDLHITSASANDVLKAGTYLTAVTKDIDNQVRNTTTPAIGADEFGTATFPTGGGSTGIYCTSSTTWNGTSWSNGSPSADKDVIFTGNKTYSGESFNACSLYVLNGATVEFTGSSTAYVVHSVNVQTTGNLTFRSGSNLIQTEADQNSGTVTVERESGLLKRLDYTLWTSPVVDSRSSGYQTLQQFSPLTTTGRFYTYNTNSGTDGLYGSVDETTTKFELGKGYLIRMPNGSTSVTGYNQGTARMTYTGSFQGTPTNGTIKMGLTYTDSRHAYNAIGNPYASPISVTDFLNANADAITGTIWLWRKTNDQSQTSYATCNLSGYIANSAPGGTSTTGNDRLNDPFAIDSKGFLNTAQGFIVKAKTSGKEIVFRNDMRIATHSTSFFRSATASEGVTQDTDGIDRLWLTIAGTNNDYSQTLVAYNTATTTNLDEGYDSENIGVAGLNIFTKVVTEGVTTKLGIQTRGAFNINDIYAVGYTAATAGTYTISLEKSTGIFANGQKIYLRDSVEGFVRELTENTYTFTTEAGTFEDRFNIIYSASNINLDTETPVALTKEVIVYNNDNQIKATAPVQIKSVVVYDTLGRTLYNNAKVNNNEFASGTINSAKQVVIVNLTLENGQTVTKKIMMN